MYKQLSKSLIFLFLALLVSLCFGSFVYAVDGVIEINQPRALAGGVTSGDDPGFPVIISESGSYRLTGNLTVENGDGIVIFVDNVTVDFNGFSIIGVGSGSRIGVLCSHYYQNITLVNGSVCSMGSDGIWLSGGHGLVEKIHAVNNGGIGINVSVASIVSSCVAYGNSSYGISLYDGIVSGNTVKYNDDDGIHVDHTGTVTGNNVIGNKGYGIFAEKEGTVVLRNSVSGNTGFGLRLGPANGYANNVLTNNNGGNANPQVLGGIEIGTNLCGSDTTCP